MNAPTRWAWILLLTAAALLRLCGLAQTPLAPDEAATAMASLDIVRGRLPAPTGEGSLLLIGNALLFAASGTGDGVARLLPALAGTVLVAVPWLWRRRLGEVGALAASVVLSFSPLLLFASRHVAGATVGLLGATLLLTVLFARVGDADEDASATSESPALVIAGVALGLTGGAVFYDLLIAGFCAWFLYHWFQRKRLRWPFAPRWMLAGLALAALISIGFGFRMDWSGIGDGLAGWFDSWRTWGGGAPGALLLDVYEPLTLLLTFMGLGWIIARKNYEVLVICAVAVAGLILALLHPGAATLTWTTVLVPCAFLAGFGVQQMVAGIPSHSMRWILLHVLAEFMLWMPAGLALAAYAHNSTMALQPEWLILLGAGVLLALHVLTAMLFTFMLPPAIVWRSTLLGLAFALLAAQFSAAWGLSFSRSSLPTEPAARVRTSLDVWNLRRTLEDLTIARGMRRDSVRLTLVADDADRLATLRWVLRDLPKTEVTAEWPIEGDGFVIAPEWIRPPEASGAWRGMRFVVISRSDGTIPRCQSFSPLPCSDLVGWLIFREAPNTLLSDYVVLWERPGLE